jgi:hypothetical protein
MVRPAENPGGVIAASGFFAGAGLLELVLGLGELASPAGLWAASGVLGRPVPYFVLAAGLWHRYALCRSIAMVYCLAALVTHGVVLGLAFAQAPVEIPRSLVLSSFYEVPSCVLLLPFLRSPRASLLFPRPLLGPRRRFPPTS